MTPRKKWFKVTMTREKIIRVYAEDEEDAKWKADEKFQPLWSAESAWLDDENNNLDL